MSGYVIADEPKPSALAHLVVNPVWPLFALMLGGTWLAIPWFVLNSIALGSPFMRRELAIAAVLVASVAAFVIGINVWTEADPAAQAFFQDKIRYVLLVAIVMKLFAGYWLFALQSRSFSIHEYYGGRVRNGILVVAAGFLLRGRVLDAAAGIDVVLLVVAL